MVFFNATLGPVQTPNFSWAELNANELKQKTSLIYIEFGSWKVRRLNRALGILHVRPEIA